MKYYLLTEKELNTLVSSQLKFTALQKGGVDNWEGYGWSMSQFITDLGYDIDEDIGFSDIAEDIIGEKYYFTTDI